MKNTIIFTIVIIFLTSLVSCELYEDPINKVMREKHELLTDAVKNVFSQLENTSEEKRDSIFEDNDVFLMHFFSTYANATSHFPVFIDPLIHKRVYVYSELGDNIQLYIFLKETEENKNHFATERPVFIFQVIKEKNKIAGFSFQNWDKNGGVRMTGINSFY